ncbi:MAG: cyclic pyranopterin monophosphate synthase MoaC [Eubacteriales bacterium]|nr:cyclic pyranopterin monophosphate synthase MoaC [Eubacteriales bacterium]
MSTGFNHFDEAGNAIMVDVTDKAPTYRTAVAEGTIRLTPPIVQAITGGTAAKGDVLGVARVAGIMAAKRTWELIPLCHPLLLSHLSIDFTIDEAACAVHARCTVKLAGKTGVEMEALTGVSVALLTIYDMCKALDKGMELGEIRLVHKEGGKSGVYDRG